RLGVTDWRRFGVQSAKRDMDYPGSKVVGCHIRDNRFVLKPFLLVAEHREKNSTRSACGIDGGAENLPEFIDCDCGNKREPVDRLRDLIQIENGIGRPDDRRGGRTDGRWSGESNGSGHQSERTDICS